MQTQQQSPQVIAEIAKEVVARLRMQMQQRRRRADAGAENVAPRAMACLPPWTRR